MHVLMRDEEKGRKKQARSNNQQGKAHVHVYIPPPSISVPLSLNLTAAVPGIFLAAVPGGKAAPPIPPG